MKECAVYKGDKMLVMGTVEECAQALGVQPRTIRFYAMPSYLNRVEEWRENGIGNNVRIAVSTDEEDEDECNIA